MSKNKGTNYHIVCHIARHDEADGRGEGENAVFCLIESISSGC